MSRQGYPAELDADTDGSDVAHAEELIRSRYSTCCAGWDADNTKWRFHSDSFTNTYGGGTMRHHLEGRKPTDTVEASIVLDGTGATTTWTYDSDRASYTASHEFGRSHPYPEDTDAAWDAWLNGIEEQLGEAAEAAWNSDVLSCERCGDHYHVTNGPCGCGEEEGSDE